MKSNAPLNYQCPICLGNKGIENNDTLLMQDDLVYRDDLVSVWINSFWISGNEGHLIIVPNKHFETLYNLPNKVGHKIFDISKKMSLALKKAYKCDGITLRQNNESAGDQHAFHYHLHVFPRYKDDNFNQKFDERVGDKKLSDPKKRLEYVKKLQDYLKKGIY